MMFIDLPTGVILEIMKQLGPDIRKLLATCKYLKRLFMQYQGQIEDKTIKLLWSDIINKNTSRWMIEVQNILYPEQIVYIFGLEEMPEKAPLNQEFLRQKIQFGAFGIALYEKKSKYNYTSYFGPENVQNGRIIIDFDYSTAILGPNDECDIKLTKKKQDFILEHFVDGTWFKPIIEKRKCVKDCPNREIRPTIINRISRLFLCKRPK